MLRRIVAPTGAEEPLIYSIETHYGASDHEVFNDWGVQVPGVMMIAWPDQWYHTSGDRVDKSDPTQLKRAVVIGAAAAYTVAVADGAMAVKIAGETASNGARRLGHQLVRGLEALNQSSAADLAQAYKKARIYLQTALANEKSTLGTVMELAPGNPRLASHVVSLKDSLDALGVAHMDMIDAHMEQVAASWGFDSVRLAWSDLEQKAAKIVPRPTALVKRNGYRGYAEFIKAVPEEQQKKFPYSRRSIANTRELQLLVDGTNSVLDIKHMLDAQHERESELQAILNYLEILKLAGLVEFQ
jgi:hypothetical protein